MAEEELIRGNVLKIAAVYADATGLSLSQVSKRAYGNAEFLELSKNKGQSLSVKKLGAVLKWFRQNWPKTADWPFLPAITMQQKPPKIKAV